MNLLTRLTAQCPKRILSLDGGGIRCLMTLGFLEKIEQILRLRHQNPDMRLSDYFDLIGGAGAGAIIAGMLSVGMPVSDVRKSFVKLTRTVFYKNKWKFWNRFSSASPLEKELNKIFRDVAFGSPALKTGLCIITRRADTGNTWLLMNHPRCVHFNRYAGIMLRKAICASVIIPDPFMPQFVQLEEKESYPFIDGGSGHAVNPALNLFLLATLQGYPFRWQAGEDQILLVSVGSGFWQARFRTDQMANPKTAKAWKENVPFLFMNDASKLNQLILQFISKTQTPWEIDRESGNLAWDLLTPQPAITYLRYDVRLEPNDLQEIGFANSDDLLRDLRNQNVPVKSDVLISIGNEAGKQKVFDNHFPNVFDLTQNGSAPMIEYDQDEHP